MDILTISFGEGKINPEFHKIWSQFDELTKRDGACPPVGEKGCVLGRFYRPEHGWYTLCGGHIYIVTGQKGVQLPEKCIKNVNRGVRERLFYMKTEGKNRVFYESFIKTPKRVKFLLTEVHSCSNIGA